MKFKDVPQKHCFTWWERDQHHTGCKIGERHAFCFDLSEVVTLHHNKDVKEPERISEDMILKFGRNGQAYLCEPGNAGRVLAYKILLIGGDFMRTEELKTVSTPKAGESREIDEQVYIILNVMLKKIRDLETIGKTVQIILDGKVEGVLSDNRIMSTLTGGNAAALTE